MTQFLVLLHLPFDFADSILSPSSVFSIDHVFQFSAVYRASQEKLEKFMVSHPLLPHSSINLRLTLVVFLLVSMERRT